MSPGSDNPLWISSTYDSANDNFILTSNTSGGIAIIPSSINMVSFASLPATTNWKLVSYGNNLLIAIAENSSTYATSSNGGYSWTQRSLPVSKNWGALEYVNNQFMLVDSSYSGSIVLTSNDGVNWTSTSITSVVSPRTISYGNGAYLITGAGSDIIRSTNGTSWTNIAPVYFSNGSIAIYKNNRFVLVGINTSVVYTSTDAITWTVRTGYTYNWVDID
jgi:hypothetical protein